MGDDIRTLLADRLPGYPIRSVVVLGEGVDNVAFEVNGELIVRGSKEGGQEAAEREMALLAAVGEVSSLPVPEPLFAEGGYLVYRKLAGVPLLLRPVARPELLAPALGAFLGRLHATPVERMARLVPYDTGPLAEWLDEAGEHYRDIADILPVRARHLVEDFLAGPPPEPPADLAFCHNDLGAEHLLADATAHLVTGVIDWTDAAVTDPARDLALLHRDLGPRFLDLVLTHYERPFGPADRRRAAFYARCALLEDLVYGTRSGPRVYAESALANLTRTFAP